MKNLIWACILAPVLLLLGCGGGGGNPGKCSGSPVYCAEFASTDSGTNTNSTDTGSTQAGLFSITGTGDTVFEIPTKVTRIRIQGSFSGTSSNFIVQIAGKGVVNEIIGTSRNPVNFDGTYLLVGGGTVEITQSAGVNWTFTEIPADNTTTTSGYFSKTGMGDTVFDLPTQVVKIRIQGSYSGASSNFIVRIAGKGVVNEIIGTARVPATFEGTYLLAAGGTVEITNSAGVDWTFTEVP